MSLATWKATSQLPVEWQWSVYSNIKWRVTTRMVITLHRKTVLFLLCLLQTGISLHFHFKWGRMHWASSEDAFCTKIHWRICFYYTNQMHMVGWIQLCERKDTPVVPCYIEIKLCYVSEHQDFCLNTALKHFFFLQIIWLGWALVGGKDSFGQGMHSLNRW